MEANPIPTTEPPQEQAHKPMTPPTSEEGDKNRPNTSHSELSDLDLDDPEDDTEIEPDHYFEGGKIPVFKPTMDQFRSFDRFVAKIDHYGMKAGIVKVVPPKEWIDSLPALDQSVKTIKINRPITQEFSGCGGMHGTFTQANIEKQRSYNLPQWKALTEEPQHQPPARRGERRRNHEKANKPAAVPKGRTTRAADTSEQPPAKKRKPARTRKGKAAQVETTEEDNEDEDAGKAPPTPTSPNTQPALAAKAKSKRTNSPKPKGGRTATTVAERRKYNQQVTADEVDESAFEDFDYRFPEKDEFTVERCQELETAYWKSLTYAPPMYGADMPGSLFEEKCESWNVAKLPNLLDVLGTKVPGVNTAYLYLGMWKATYAWHLEDVDLYSINYIHFGAPKQWYSISQEDARRFEAAMRDVWPNDAKHCGQFLRHKTYLISPSLLKSKYNITVNRLVHYEGEFVITFPYGYHSGYNLGYNCAESVNFATESWLDYGRIAKKCDCEADSVWVDVGEIERKLRGEPTPEYYEETDEEDDELEDGPTDLPTPPHSVTGRGKGAAAKRKKAAAQTEEGKKKKKIKIRIKKSTHEPCDLCPNDLPSLPLVPTDTGKRAHELCAQYTKETWIETDEQGAKMVRGVGELPRGRLDLKCSFCRSKKGTCFQCSEKKCCRAFHATCAAAAGVRVDFGRTPVYYDAEGVEYYQDLYDFRCRFHRTKRPKGFNPATLESNATIRRYIERAAMGDMIQAQPVGRDIFAGHVVDKRLSEGTVVLRVVPDGDEVEVELKYVLAPALEESKRPQASPNARPLPAELLDKVEGAGGEGRGLQDSGEPFTEGGSLHWGEHPQCRSIPKNPAQVQVNLEKPNQLWLYLGKPSKPATALYTDSPGSLTHNPAADFLASVAPARPAHGALAASKASSPAAARPSPSGPKPAPAGSKPYDYKPKMALSPMKAPSPGMLPGLTTTVSGQPWSAQAPAMQPPSGHFSPSPSPYPQANPSKFTWNTVNSPQKQRSQTSRSSSSAAVRRPSGASARSSSGTTPVTKPDEAATGVGAQKAPLAPLDVSAQALAGSASALSSPDVSGFMEHMSRYPYLLNAYTRKPRQYRSPYPCRGSPFSDEYAAKLGIEQEQRPRTQGHSRTGSMHSQSVQPVARQPGKPQPQNFYPSSANTQAYQSSPTSYQAPPPPLHKHSSSQGSNLGQFQLPRPIKRESFGAANGVMPFPQLSGPSPSIHDDSMTNGAGPIHSNAMSPTMMAHGDVSLPQMNDMH